MPNSRSAKPLSLPNHGDPDRKRALNVLAQRRYRQRKRERINALERQVQAATPSSPSTLASYEPATEESLSPCVPLQSSMSARHASEGISERPARSSNPSDPNPDQMENMWDEFINPPLDEIEVISSTSSTGNTSAEYSLNSIFDSSITTIDSPFFSSAGNVMDFSTELQDLTRSQFAFTDDGSLEVPELKVLKAGLQIAQLLGCAQKLFDFTSHGVLNISSEAIPPAFQPTPAQRQIPHHPILDILPWPEVRTRMIVVFSQPEALRPPSARDPMALLNLVYDIDDSAEGIRVEGEDGLDGDNWEVGQQFFRNWWWALDRSVVENSNRLRTMRGAERLKLMAA